MMKRACLFSWSLCLAGLLLILSGCRGASPSVAYYSLVPIDRDSQGRAAMTRPGPALGIGPVSIADYLKRPQIVTRETASRLDFSESHRWAGMLERDMASVLAGNLGLLLGSEEVMLSPWPHYFAPDYRLAVDVVRFDTNLQGDAVLSVRWAVSDASGKEVLDAGQGDYQQTLARPGYDELVAAESDLLAQFSRDLAEAISRLQKTSP